MQWYYAINGQRHGPVNQAEFERLLRTGVITQDTPVWRKPMAAWQSLAEVLAADPSAAVLTPPEMPPLPAELSPGPANGGWAATVAADEAGPAVYGGFWRRVAARIIDGLVLWFAWQIAVGVVGTFFFHDTMTMLEKLKGRQPTPEQLMATMGFAGMALELAVFVVLRLVYDVFFLRKYAATPGKLALGLAIRRADGSPLCTGRIIGRFFAMGLNNFTFGLSYLVVAFDDQKRGVQDYVCDTRVVRTKR